jgi:hypothetical protein
VRDINDVVGFDGIHVLTIRDEWSGFNPFHIQAVIASSSSKVEDKKDGRCDDHAASKCSAYSRCGDGAVFGCYSEWDEWGVFETYWAVEWAGDGGAAVEVVEV